MPLATPLWRGAWHGWGEGQGGPGPWPLEGRHHPPPCSPLPTLPATNTALPNPLSHPPQPGTRRRRRHGACVGHQFVHRKDAEPGGGWQAGQQGPGRWGGPGGGGLRAGGRQGCARAGRGVPGGAGPHRAGGGRSGGGVAGQLGAPAETGPSAVFGPAQGKGGGMCNGRGSWVGGGGRAAGFSLVPAGTLRAPEA